MEVDPLREKCKKAKIIVKLSFQGTTSQFTIVALDHFISEPAKAKPSNLGLYWQSILGTNHSEMEKCGDASIFFPWLC